eukprot:TRINITY_DN111615_c0_g1_i1.p1 TRINITY_DN111615_c0_g1~~TRINITY_DN111615_c0_g1_i1.p1  ORF type:complete len:313 (-),score=49.11 TRINITY_DN111615_c0_g1_i1:42-980(-)
MEGDVRKATPLEEFLCGSIAGVVTRSCIAPLDVLKIRLQVQVESTASWQSVIAGGARPTGYYTGLPGTLLRILQDEGLQGLWRGNVPGSLHWLTYSGLQFSTYEYVKDALSDPDGNIGIEVSRAAFIAGGSGGIMATTFTYPFDLIRTMWTAQGVPRAHPTLASLVRHIVTSDGLAGLYRGFFATMVLHIPQTAMQFGSYGTLKSLKLLDESHGTFNAAINGFLAGAASKALVQPLDTVRRRLQVCTLQRDARYGAQIEYSGYLDCVRTMYLREGVWGFYKGLVPNVLKNAPASAITFAVYEHAKSWILEAR